MKLSDFSFKYPKELVAQRPLERRDASRMMVVNRAKGCTTHAGVADLPNFLRAGDLAIVNDSKVVPARLFGTRENGEAIELLVIELAESRVTGHELRTWRCLLKKSKKIRTGEKFFFGADAVAKVIGREGIYLATEFENNALELAMKYHGVPPLPPYIEREGFESYTDEDRERYQTVYARVSGSAAAPTAGLHLSDALLKRIKTAGAAVVNITLHIGIDTFAPVRAEDIAKHKMHGERFEISEETARAVSLAKMEGRRIIAVGTTTMRALESTAVGNDGGIAPGWQTTKLFIRPGYKFKIVDALLTNFHQPRSTLLVLISAFAGKKFILDCYEKAVRDCYRLFSYGDCMLIV